MDSSHDPRSQYLANTAAHMFGHPELAVKIAKAPELAMFLNELNVKALQIITNGKSIKCIAGQVAEPPQGTMELHFVKLDNEDVDKSKIQNQILISSIRQSSISSLYALISKIYVPLLRQGDKDNDNPNNQLRDLLY